MRIVTALSLAAAGLAAGAPEQKPRPSKSFEDEWNKNFPTQVISNSLKAQRRKVRKAAKLANRR